jgi:hypothetical protein
MRKHGHIYVYMTRGSFETMIPMFEELNLVFAAYQALLVLRINS